MYMKLKVTLSPLHAFVSTKLVIQHSCSDQPRPSNPNVTCRFLHKGAFRYKTFFCEASYADGVLVTFLEQFSKVDILEIRE